MPKALTKQQLAERAGVSQRTFRRWLADPYIQEQLKPLGLKRQQVLLPPRAVKIICDHYAITID